MSKRRINGDFMYNTEKAMMKVEEQLIEVLNTLEELRHELRFQNQDLLIDGFKERINSDLRVFKRSFIDAFSKGWIF